MSTVTRLLTAEDLAGMPEDAVPTELRSGELITLSPGSPDHGRVNARIVTIITTFVDEHDLGETYCNDTGFLLQEHPDTVLGPDVAFIRTERLSQLEKLRGYFTGSPDLAIEVISPGDVIKAVHAKAKDFIRFGTLQCWVVNPRDRKVTIHVPDQTPLKLVETDYIEGGSILPGFRRLIADFFPIRK
jgi:Uma2 family endonuclease